MVVNLYEAGTAKLCSQDQTRVTLVTETRYPAEERIRIKVGVPDEKNFTVKLRMPAWCHSPSVEVKGQPVALAPGADGYVAVQTLLERG